MAERILTLRELNRATLARQLLLQRASLAAKDAIKQLAGMQSQLANPPYIGLWSRLHAFERTELIQLLEQRQVVRTSMMRRTVHLTTAEDYLHFRPALLPLHTQHLNAFFANNQIHGLERERLEATLWTFFREKPRTNVDLRNKLMELFPTEGEQLLYIVRICFPLIQIYPGGVWGVGGSPAYTEATTWLGRAFVPPQTGLSTLLESYLAAFGPASVKDLQMWSGLNKLQGTVNALPTGLIAYRDEQGRELFDLPDAPLPEPGHPVPVRFLPDFDNLVLAHHDRQRILAQKYRPFVFPGNSRVLPTFLVDGFVRGIWKIERSKTGAKLWILPFEPLATSVLQDLQEEGERLLHWAAENIHSFEIAVVPYEPKLGGQNLWGRL